MENIKSKEVEIKKEEKIIVYFPKLPAWIEILRKAYNEYKKNGKL